MNRKRLILGLFLATASCLHFYAQEQISTTSNSATTTVSLGVTEVSLIKASEAPVNLQLNPQEAGMPIETSKSDSTARLLLSSVISTSSPRTLTARISGGTIPSGTNLALSAMQPNTNFVGSAGIFAAPILLDDTDKPIITDIETCYSGTGISDGYPLRFTYSLDINSASYSTLRATTGTQVVVTLTLSAAL